MIQKPWKILDRLYKRYLATRPFYVNDYEINKIVSKETFINGPYTLAHFMHSKFSWGKEFTYIFDQYIGIIHTQEEIKIGSQAFNNLFVITEKQKDLKEKFRKIYQKYHKTTNLQEEYP